jgi:hypothetical protein
MSDARLPDINGGDLFNRCQATAHLAECAHDWARIARLESAPDEVRVAAAAYARAVRAEGNLPSGGGG